jgi:hypothetical protein
VLQEYDGISRQSLLARLRGFGRFDVPCPFPINGLAGKVFTT